MAITNCYLLTNFNAVVFYIETSCLLCSARQMTCFYIKRNIGLKWVKLLQIILQHERLTIARSPFNARRPLKVHGRYVVIIHQFLAQDTRYFDFHGKRA